MTNYKIIADEQKLDEFIEWLPELKPSEGYYLQLFGRKKYLESGTIQSGQQSLNRFVCKKERIKDKIKQMEIPVGLYRNRDIVLPQECLCLYICPNPRCHEKAAKNLLKTLADKITKKYENYNTYQLAMTELHKAKSRSFVVDFDYDEVDYESVREDINSVLNKEAFKVLKTRGGFHILVMPEKIDHDKRNVWHNKLASLNADVIGDTLIPCPGTFQGGFIPYFLENA
jgi:hypothetical protein